jgi:hypothetical protein
METPAKLRIKFLTSLGLLFLTTACGVKPITTHTINSCGGETEIDVKPGDLEQIKAPGIDLKYKVLPDGRVKWYSNPEFYDVPPSKRSIGNIDGKHLDVELLGDTDGNGRQDIRFKSVCPVPATPIPQPKGTPTPQSLELNNSHDRLTAYQRGFNGTKPAGRGGTIFRRGG